jgi:hypothetical protein
MQGNIEEELESNMDPIINNIQVELIISLELVVSIIELATIAINHSNLFNCKLNMYKWKTHSFADFNMSQFLVIPHKL